MEKAIQTLMILSIACPLFYLLVYHQGVNRQDVNIAPLVEKYEASVRDSQAIITACEKDISAAYDEAFQFTENRCTCISWDTEPMYESLTEDQVCEIHKGRKQQ